MTRLGRGIAAIRADRGAETRPVTLHVTGRRPLHIPRCKRSEQELRAIARDLIMGNGQVVVIERN